MEAEEVVNMNESKEKATAGIFIYENPEDFIEAIEQLQESYLASINKGAEGNE